MLRKKLLSLGLATAMVATTAMPAFAKTYTDVETATLAPEVTITGDVEDESGATKPGTLSVTVPTAANFTVNQDGDFLAPNGIEITNGGEAVEVYAYEFIDINNEQGINVVKPTDLASANRTHIALSLKGNEGIAYFGSDRASITTGVFKDAELSDKSTGDGIKIATLAKGGTQTLTLAGEAGQSGGSVNSPEKDTFTLRLKIKKAENPTP